MDLHAISLKNYTLWTTGYPTGISNRVARTNTLHNIVGKIARLFPPDR